MKNVASVRRHGLFEVCGTLPVGSRKIDNERFPSIRDLRGTDGDVLCGQLLDNPPIGQMLHKARVPDRHQDVISEMTRGGNTLGKFVGPVTRATDVTATDGFPGRECADVQRGHGTSLRFEDR